MYAVHASSQAVVHDQAQCTKCICFYHSHNFHSDITFWNPHIYCESLQMQPFYLPINNSWNLLKSHVLKMPSGRKCNSQIAPWNGFHSNTVCKGQKISETIFLWLPKNQLKICHNFFPKGQIISKANCVFLTSPKKRTKKWKNLTCYYYDISSQIFFVCLFGESRTP